MAAISRSAFRLVSKVRCNGLVDVFKYRSDRSGLRVTIADVKGPNVNGFICLATETDCDDGLPHTLEHLIFMGSHKYPYKGMLDLVANRCLASGTNAWTDTDHTCYTLTTAGSEGFLIMLPIYLDHIFNPLLTDSQFLTEVHHITGEGEDSGVVYCEMQDWESRMESIVDLKTRERLYPEGCGYRYQTGGKLGPLRTSCSNEKVRAYHEGFYDPRNSEIIITGPVDHDAIFRALADIDSEMAAKKVTEKPFRRPWQSAIPPMKVQNAQGVPVDLVVVPCPSDEGKSGLVTIGWRGPAATDQYTVSAIDALLDYLVDTSVSPLQRDFIQIPDPYCATIEKNIEEFSEVYVSISFSGAKLDKLKSIHPQLMKSLHKIMSGEEDFDMKRMDDMLRQSALKIQDQMESGSHRMIATLIIADFLYGNTEQDTRARLDQVAVYKRLRTEPKEFWINILREYLSDKRPHVCVIGEPNQAVVKQLSEAEKKRLEGQKADLGEDGLKACGVQLAAAIEANEANEPPEELLERLIVNSLDGIRFFDINTSTNQSLDEDNNSSFPLSRLPCTTILNDICGTNFVDLSLRLDASQVGLDRKPLVPLWGMLLFESPILRDGELIPYEKVVTELNRDLVSFCAGAGIKSSFFRVYTFNVKTDLERYKTAIEWTRRLLHDTQYQSDRIRVLAQQLINSADASKRDGHAVAQFLLDSLSYEAQSPKRLENVIFQEKFLKPLLEQLDKEPDQVVSNLNSLRDEITAPSRTVMTLLCEADKFKELNEKPEDAFVNGLLPERLKVDGDGPRAKLNGSEPTYVKPSNKFGRAVITAVGACESCYLIQNTQCPLRYQDPDLPTLRVLLQYLEQSEGPMWKGIRGRGLAYGAYCNYNVDSGLLKFLLYRTSDPVLAYKEGKEIIEQHWDDPEDFDDDEFDAAKRSLIFDLIAEEASIKKASTQAILNFYRGVPKDYNRKFMQRVWNVKKEDLPKVGQKYLTPLFDPKLCNTAIACHPSKLNEVIKGFKALGRDLKVVSLEDEEFFRL